MLSKAFTYVFDDNSWVEKLIMMAVFSLLSLIPIIGLLPLAIIFGWMIELVRRMQKREAYPLPMWINLDKKLSDGASVLMATAFYHVPVLLVLLVQAIIPSIAQEESVRAIIAMISLAFVYPITLAYILVIWLMLGVGCVHFAKTKHGSAFYDFNALFRIAYIRIGSTMRWLVLTILANMIFFLIPCVGWLLATVFLIPTQGFLLGQLALRLEPELNEQQSPAA